MRHAAALLALAAFAAPLPAQSVKLPPTLTGLPGIPIPIIAEVDGKNCVWMAPDAGLVIIDGGFFKGDSTRAMLFGPAGKYRVWAVTAKGDAVSPVAECVVTIGTPPPPVPPVPPTPPAPPVPNSGLSVLFVLDKDRDAALSVGQQGLLYAKATRDLLNARCAMGPDGKTREWRIWDKGVDPAGDPSAFAKEAFARPRASVPWVVAANGQSVYEGPLPANLDEFTRILEKLK